MKLDSVTTTTSGDLIKDVSFKLPLNFTGSSNDSKSRVIQRTFTDGSVSFINYGSRREERTSFKFIEILRGDYENLYNFLFENEGKIIKVTEENTDEKLFTEWWEPTVYYCEVLEHGDYKEEDFSVTRELGTVSVKLQLVGEDPDAPFNNTVGNVNALIKVNTIQSDIESDTRPSITDLDGNPLPEGTRWYDTINQEIFVHTGETFHDNAVNAASWDPVTRTLSGGPGFTNLDFKPGDSISIEGNPSAGVPLSSDAKPGVYEIASKIAFNSVRLLTNDFSPNLEVDNVRLRLPFSELLYIIPADEPDLGFLNGIFYFAAFFDMSPTEDLIDEDWKSGVINHKSIKLGGQSINLSKGPNISNKRGFSFSIDNSEKFSSFVNTNKISLYGAITSLEIWDDLSGSAARTKRISGENTTNEFTYSDYKFSVEPFLYNRNRNFTVKSIKSDEQRYLNVKTDVVGKPPYRTYGEFDVAALQNISKISSFLKLFRKNPPFTGTGASGVVETSIITAFINRNETTELIINRDALQDLDFGFIFGVSDLHNINNNGGFSLKVLSNTDPAGEGNIEQVAIVQEIVDAGDGFYTLTMTSSLPITPPASGTPLVKPFTDDTIRIVISNGTFTFQMNEQPSGGFGVFDVDSQSVDTSSKEIFFLSGNGKDLVSIPTSGFVESEDKESVSFSLDGVNDPTSIDTFVRVGEKENIIIRNMTPVFFPDRDNVEFDDSSGPIQPDPAWVKDNYYLGFLFGASGARVKNMVAWTSATERATMGFHAGPHNTGTFTDSPLGVLKSVLSEESTESDVSYFIANDPEDYPVLSDNDFVTDFEFPVKHLQEVDETLTVDSIIKLGIKLKCYVQATINHRVPSSTVGQNRRIDPTGVKIIMRARRKDNTHFTSSSWEYTLSPSELGVGIVDRGNFASSNIGTITINCLPDGVPNGAFSAGVQTPISGWDYNVDYLFSNRLDRDSSPSSINYRRGDRVYISSVPAIDRYNGTAWVNDDIADSGDLVEGIKILLNEFNSTPEVFILDNFNPPNLDPAIEGVDYNEVAEIKGQDVFDLSPLFTAPQEWPDVEALEFSFVGLETSNTHNEPKNPGDTLSFLERLFRVNCFLDGGPYLYRVENINTEDVPTFSAVKGKIVRDFDPAITFDFPTNPASIAYDVIDEMFPGKVNIPALVTLMGQSNRGDWKFRRQFIKTQSSDVVLKELLTNLWSVMVFDEDDNLEIKTLNIDDYKIEGDDLVLSDANIIVDSFKNLKFRPTNDIHNTFELEFDFNPISEFSSSVPIFNKGEFLSTDRNSNADEQMKSLMRNSQILYNARNTLKMGFPYHYDGDEIPLRKMVVDFYVYNSWSFKVSVALELVMGTTPLRIMDKVSLSSFFFTDDLIVKCFVTKIDMDIYGGTAELSLYAPRPPGFLGPLCDSFKDALRTGRGVLPINDAGKTGRTTGSFTVDDAGRSPRGIISC